MRRPRGSRCSVPLVGVVAALPCCVAPEGASDEVFDQLADGMWVEARGRETVDGVAEVTDIAEADRGTNTSDKMEVSARAQGSIEEGTLRVLGEDFEVVEKTEFESLEREQVEPFPVEPGEWLQIKGRIRDRGGLRARTIRRIEPRTRFKVEGEITTLDPDRRIVEVGALPLRVAQGVDLERLGQNDPLTLFFEDEQKSVPFTLRLSDAFRVGGQLSVESRVDDELDLDRTRDRDQIELQGEAKLDLLWILDEQGSFALIEGSTGREEEFKFDRPNETTRTGNLSRAYAFFRLSDTFSLQVGRQDFDEEREWLYDEILDGARVVGRLGAFAAEVSASTGREFLAEENPFEDIKTYMALVRYFLNEDHWLTGYAIRRDDSSLANFEPFLFGVRSFSRPWQGLGHWAELAFASGDDGAMEIDGYAFDVGLMYRSDIALRPTIAAGYAFGSGKRFGSNRVGFRQTGLQDNNGKFGGVTSFKYYGELLEPELSNLEVMTLGLGVRPARSWSLDLVFHTYRQDWPSTSFASDLRASPTGQVRDLGWESDLVLGYRYGRRASVEVIGARFDPGGAFIGQDAAYRAAVQVRLKF